MASDNLSSDLILTFAHDLRQPLRTIVMQAQRIQRQAGSLSDETNARLNEIVAAARGQEELIASFVEYDQAGRQGLESTRLLPLKVVVQTACMKVESYRKQCGGVIRFEHEAAPAVQVPPTISRVVEKVLHNAMKFRRRGCRPEAHIEARDENHGVLLLRIVDAGLGIEPEYRETVFEPFRRLHPASEFPGSGMGLTICRRLTTALGGEISVENPGPERGVAVRISIPSR